MKDKSSLKELILPSTVNDIGSYAFSGVTLGTIPNNDSEGFYFLTIPSSVTNISEYAFDSSEFVYFESNNPPSFYNNTFSYDLSKIFVNGGALDDYLSLNMLRSDRVYQKGELSDDRKYIVRRVDEIVNGIGLTLRGKIKIEQFFIFTYIL